MSILRRTVLLSGLALVVATSGCQPFPITSASLGAPPAIASMATADLLGQVAFPVVSAGGANVVSAGGANVVAAGGANVVSAGGANVVSAGGANVVSAGGANVVSAGGMNFRVLQAAQGELPVFGAVVILRDPVTRARLPWVRPVFTDERGRFRFEGVPAGVNYLIEVAFLTKDQKAFRLLAIARPTQSDAPVAVDWRTTAVAGALAEAATAQGGLYVAEPQALADAAAEVARVGATLDAAERDRRVTAVVAVTTPAATGQETAIVEPGALDALRNQLGQVAPRPAQAGTLVITDVMPPSDLAAPSALATGLATADMALAERLAALKAIVTSAPSGEQATTATNASQLVNTKPALPAPTPAPQTGSNTGGTSNTGTAVGSTVGGVTAPVTNVVGGVVDAVTGSPTGTTTGAVGAVGNAVEGTTGTVGGVVTDTTGAVGGAVGGTVGDTVGAVGGAVGGAAGAVGGVVGGLTGSGGSTTGGTSTTEGTSTGGTSTGGTTSGGSTSGSGTSTSGGSTSGSGSSSGGGLVGGVIGTVGGILGGNK
jgi:hypothetical protein